MMLMALAVLAGALWTGVTNHRIGLLRKVARPDDRVPLLQMVDGLVAALSAGSVPAGAVRAAAGLAATRVHDQGCAKALLVVVGDAQAGRELGESWSSAAAEVRRGDHARVLAMVARGWLLSRQLGCPLAPSLRICADTLRADLERDRRIAAATAGPRATMHLLTVLPVLGLGLAALAGLSPWSVLASPVAVVTLVPGLGLMALGRVVSARMIRSAARPAGVPS